MLTSSLPAADGFLDTIPEDQSVAAQRVQNLSGASVVGSNDSEREEDNGEGPQKQEQHGGAPRVRTKKRRTKGPGSVTSSNHAIIDDGPPETRKNNRPGTSGETSTTSVSCTTKRLMIWFSVSLLVVAVLAGGLHSLIRPNTDRSKESNKADAPMSSSLVPTPDLTFPPNLYFEVDSEIPTASPAVIQAGISGIDNVISQMSSADDFLDPDTPQGICRSWITETVDTSTAEETSIVQRYVLCVLYYTTLGDEWTLMNGTMLFLDPDLNECDWKKVGCVDDVVGYLSLPDSNLQGSIPSELIHLSGLEYLRLGENRLKGTIPLGLLELKKLVWLDLSSNALTGTIPSSATSPSTPTQYSPLQVLYLDDNQLKGTVPFFDTLQRMRVQNNMLTGFDPGYSTLESLERWKMYNNSIRGPLPSFWDAPNLKYVDLALNEWTGSIPESLWNLPLLEALVLHDAKLTGTLPESTVSDHWRYVWLHANRLSGSIPLSFASNWGNVTHIVLHDNALTGEVPEENCGQWPILERMETDCNRSNLTCACCTTCHS